MEREDLDRIVVALHDSRGLAHKRDIAAVVSELDIADEKATPVGDDCAAIADGEGYLLFAIEGFINKFVVDDPWFAGWCGVMVNVSDIYAMGGRPTAVVDAIWDRSDEFMRPVLQGLAAASAAYGVPIVGGHSNARSEHAQLAVSIVGRATHLLTSFDAKPGDVLIAAIDLRGAYREPYPHWCAALNVDPARLRGDLEILPLLAEAGLCGAAKDISQAGVLGTLLMLLECSGVGAVIDIDLVPTPAGVDRPRWLLATFPSFGFLLSVKPANADLVLKQFAARGIAASAIGLCNDSGQLRLRSAGEEEMAWDFHQQPVIGCGAGSCAAIAQRAERFAPAPAESAPPGATLPKDNGVSNHA
jgi:AIR synthase-related protein